MSVYSILFHFPVPIILALMINELRNPQAKRVIQTISYMPHFISMVVVCSLIRSFVSGSGVINTMISALNPKWMSPNLLTVAGYYRPIHILSSMWQEIGWDSIIYLAALSGVDPQLYEAAYIDGASKWQRILRVTLPGITPVITVQFIMRVGRVMSVGYEKILLLYNPGIYETAADLKGVLREHDDVDRHVVIKQELCDGVHRHLERLRFGIAVDAGGNQGKGNTLAVVFVRKLQRVPVAGGQQLTLAVMTVLPDGACCMDDVSARQAVPAGDFRLTGLASVQRPARLKKLRPRGTVDRAVHAAAAQQGRVGGVDDGIHRHLRNIVSDNLKRHGLFLLAPEPGFLCRMVFQLRQCGGNDLLRVIARIQPIGSSVRRQRHTGYRVIPYLSRSMRMLLWRAAKVAEKTQAFTPHHHRAIDHRAERADGEILRAPVTRPRVSFSQRTSCGNVGVLARRRGPVENLRQSTRWQLTQCPPPMSRAGGMVSLQALMHRGHRLWNGQPLGGFAGLGTSPCRWMRVLGSLGSRRGIAESSACV